jgi:hypothetical protein
LQRFRFRAAAAGTWSDGHREGRQCVECCVVLLFGEDSNQGRTAMEVPPVLQHTEALRQILFTEVDTVEETRFNCRDWKS